MVSGATIVTRDILAGLMSNGAYRNEPAATYG